MRLPKGDWGFLKTKLDLKKLLVSEKKKKKRVLNVLLGSGGAYILTMNEYGLRMT